MIAAALAVLENEGQRKELSEFYKKHESRFLNIALHIVHNKEGAEDAVQEAFLSITDKPDLFFSLNETERIRYLCGVIKNVSVDIYNKAQKLQTEKLSEDIVYQNDDNPVENSLFDNISHDEILDFIGTLPETQRAVLVLAYSSRMKSDEIAAALNIPVTVVYKRLYSARRAVKLFLEERRNNNV